MKQGGQGLQDYYLNQLRKEKILATVFLTNGFQLRGRVVSFDNFTVLLVSKENNNLYLNTQFQLSPRKRMSL